MFGALPPPLLPVIIYRLTVMFLSAEMRKLQLWGERGDCLLLAVFQREVWKPVAL